MKIAIASTGDGTDAKVHNVFGRCDFFLIFNTDSQEFKAMKNQYSQSSSGAGTACAQNLFDKGVKVVISGQVGPNAYEILTRANIDIFLSPPGVTVYEAIDKYKKGQLKKMQIKKF